MTAKRGLTVLFGLIFSSLLLWTGWASVHQSVTAWGGLTRQPDNYWTIATLMDAYFGFTTFYVWVAFKERGIAARIAWFIAIMLLGNMAMSAYVLRELARLAPGEGVSAMLTRRNPG